VNGEVVNHRITERTGLVVFDTPILFVPGTDQLGHRIVNQVRQVMQDHRRVLARATLISPLKLRWSQTRTSLPSTSPAGNRLSWDPQ
jgi:hypothetical protein